MHNGDAQVAPPGHPRRGGAPEQHGLYSRHLKPEQREAFDRARLGSLDDEIRLAKAKLDWATRKWAQDEDGGLVTMRGEAEVIRPWTDVVGEWEERVRRLELARQQLLSKGSGSGKGAIERLMERLREDERHGV